MWRLARALLCGAAIALLAPVAAHAEDAPAAAAAGPATSAPATPSTGAAPELVDRLHDLENRLQSLEGRLDRTAAARPAAEVTAELDALRAEVRELRERLGALELQAPEAGAPASAGAARTAWSSSDEGALEPFAPSAVAASAGPVRVYVHGLLQARWTAEIGATAGAAQTAALGSNSFDVHHGTMAIEALLGDWLAARVALDLGSRYFPAAAFAPRVGLLRDAFAEVRPLPWLRLRAGQVALPFGRQRLTPDEALAAPERNIATLAFAPDRDLGVLVEAAPFGGRLLAQASVSDGLDAGLLGTDNTARVKNDNLDLRYVVRIVGQPLGPLPLVEGDPAADRPFRFAVGGAFLYDLTPTDDASNNDRNGDGRIDNVEVIGAAAEAAVSWWRLTAQGEFFYRRERRGAGLPESSYHGGYAALQGAILPRYLLLDAHAAYAEPHTLGLQPRSAPSFDLPGAPEPVLDGMVPSSAWQVGATLVALWRTHRAKLQLGWDWHRRDQGASVVAAHVAQVQATVGF